MSYSRAASQIAQELLELLGEEEVDQLREELVALGEDGWLELEWEIRNEAVKFLSASPAQREKLNKWKDPIRRRHLVLSAYRQACLASAVLEETSRLAEAEGASWRDMAGFAAAAGFRVVAEAGWIWPFYSPAPFPEWEPPPPPPRSPSYTVILRADGSSEKIVD